MISERNGKRELGSQTCLLKPFVSLFHFYYRIFFIHKKTRVDNDDFAFFAALQLFHSTKFNFGSSSLQVFYWISKSRVKRKSKIDNWPNIHIITSALQIISFDNLFDAESGLKFANQSWLDCDTVLCFIIELEAQGQCRYWGEGEPPRTVPLASPLLGSICDEMHRSWWREMMITRVFSSFYILQKARPHIPTQWFEV